MTLWLCKIKNISNKIKSILNEVLQKSVDFFAGKEEASNPNSGKMKQEEKGVELFFLTFSAPVDYCLLF